MAEVSELGLADDGMSDRDPAPYADTMAPVADGIRLHVRDWSGDGPPLVCLPGLARTLEDFTEFAGYFSSAAGGARRVIAISARGRGLSDRDPDPGRYSVAIEANDVLVALDHLSIPSFALIGTSRGGLQAMAIGATRPAAVEAIVLNDIGPVIELEGLLRIRGYVGVGAPPSDWKEAEARIEAAFAAQFSALTRGDLALMARRTWRDGAEGLESAYDPRLAETLASLDLTTPTPPLWELFDALGDIPMMVVRGEMSDILSRETVDVMASRRTALATYQVAGQGHAPTLADRPTLQAIVAFLSAVPK